MGATPAPWERSVGEATGTERLLTPALVCGIPGWCCGRGVRLALGNSACLGPASTSQRVCRVSQQGGLLGFALSQVEG